MIQSLFLVSPTGEVLIERHFRGATSRSVVDYYWERASATLNHHGGISTTSTIISSDPMALLDAVPPVIEIPPEELVGSGGGGGESPSSPTAASAASSSSSSSSSLYLFSVLRDGLSYLAACADGEVSPLLVIEFLHRLADIFVDYFGSPADESAIKDNFSTVYQILEEMVDYGWPLTTEPNALQAMIRPPTVMGKIQQAVTGGASTASVVSDELPSGTVSNMPWRRAGVKYNTNEIYIDIVEEVDAILETSGSVVSFDVSGSVQAQSLLSGVPDLLLTFREPEIIQDCSFHPCVRYGRYEQDRVISFVPPDGSFELMRYRARVSPGMGGGFTPPIYCSPQFSYPTGGSDHDSKTGRVIINVGVRAIHSLVFSSSSSSSAGGGGGPGGGSRRGPMVVEDVSVTIPFAKDMVRTANLTVNCGKVVYDEAGKVAKWILGKVDEKKRPQLTGTMVLADDDFDDAEAAALATEMNSLRAGTAAAGGPAADSAAATAAPAAKKSTRVVTNPPLTVSWKVPLASVSGLSVSGLSMAGENYKPYKGVRNITRSGLFQVRCQ